MTGLSLALANFKPGTGKDHVRGLAGDHRRLPGVRAARLARDFLAASQPAVVSPDRAT
jgi:hypothetical protein